MTEAEREPECSGLNVCAPPNSYAETLIPTEWSLEVGPLGGT